MIEIHKTVQDKKEGTLVKLATYFQNNWLKHILWIIPYVAATSTALITSDSTTTNSISTALGITPNKLLIFIMVLLTFVDAFLRGNRQHKDDTNLESLINENQSLKTENNEYAEALRENEQKLFRTTHNATSKNIALCIPDKLRTSNKTRVSLYLFADNQFYLSGRYSARPDFNLTNRFTFSANEGCIGKAWKDGIHFCNDLPCFETAEAEYNRKQKDLYNIKIADSKNLRMKSRCYYAHAISHDITKIGVIVFESIECDMLKEDELRTLVEDKSEFFAGLLNDTKEITLQQRRSHEQS